MTDWGYNTIGTAGNDNPSNNVVWCKAVGTPASNGVLTTIQAYCARIDSTPTVVFALYTDSSGAPGTKICDGASLTPGSPGASFGWVSQDLSSLSQSITLGTQYWFAILVPGGDEPAPPAHDVNVKFDTNGSATEGYFKGNGTPAAGTFPANATGATGFTNERWSIYGSYTPVGGPQMGRLELPMQNTQGLVMHTAVRQALPW